MRKIHLLGLALFAVFAFAAFAASSAFAAAEWLWNGGPILTGEELLVESEGELELIHLANGFLEPEAKVLCSGIFDGVVLSNGEDLITELLSLAGVKITEANPLVCSGTMTCENPGAGNDVLVVAENLPWQTKLELMLVGTSGSLYLDLFFAEPGGELPAYLINCLVFGAEHITLCEGETSADITLDGPNLLAMFSKEELELEGLEGKCGNVANVALQEGDGIIKHAGGGELDVSG